MTAALVFSTASLLVSGFSFLFFRSYLNRRTGHKRILVEFQEEARQIIAGIDEAADRDLLLVEERVKALKIMLQDVDNRINELNRRIGVFIREEERQKAQEYAYAELGARRGGNVPAGAQARKSPPLASRFTLPDIPAQSSSTGFSASPPAALDTPLPAETPRPLEPLAAPPAASADRRSRSVPASEGSPGGLPAKPLTGTAEEPVRPRFAHPKKPIKPKPAPFAERVRELHLAGFSSDLIASHLNATVSEVDLVIALGEWHVP
ncbi:MAG: hypothetical protein LBD37_03780 [Treponema sp.]|jgi:hypothetical protein|nr:hypothetical protein [Treponema sp.]